jgi:protein arginine kinase activator
MHAGVKHLGKVPSRSVKKKSQDDSEELLSKELKKAVEEENYEKAAKLRDRLKKLQAKSSASA